MALPLETACDAMEILRSLIATMLQVVLDRCSDGIGAIHPIHFQDLLCALIVQFLDTLLMLLMLQTHLLVMKVLPHLY